MIDLKVIHCKCYPIQDKLCLPEQNRFLDYLYWWGIGLVSFQEFVEHLLSIEFNLKFAFYIQLSNANVPFC